MAIVRDLDDLETEEFTRVLSDEEIAEFLMLWLNNSRKHMQQIGMLMMRAKSDDTSSRIWRAMNSLHAWSCDTLGLED